MALAVSFRPDLKSHRLRGALSSNFTCVPPTSMTRIVRALPSERLACATGIARLALALAFRYQRARHVGLPPDRASGPQSSRYPLTARVPTCPDHRGKVVCRS